MKAQILLAALILPATAGCQASYLAYVHSASLSVAEVSVAPNQQQVKLSIGYDRSTYAIVPRRGDDNSDAMSVTSASRVEVKGLGVVKFGHIVATGAPAVRLAKNQQDFGMVVNGLFGDKPAPGDSPNKPSTQGSN